MKSIDFYKTGARNRVMSVRLRTLIVTSMMFGMLVLYCIVQLSLQQRINVIDMILIAIIQILSYSLYYPEGQLFGETNKTYSSNKKLYNQKANYVNNNQMQKILGEYCEYDFEKRKNEWYLNECGALGITVEELDDIKQQYSEKEIKRLESIKAIRKINDKDEEITIHFGRAQRKRMHALIFKPCPVEKNEADAILSACEIDRKKHITDGSLIDTSTKVKVFLLRAALMAAFIGYIGYSLREGFSFANIMQFFMFFGTMISTAVTAYSQGESNIKVYKNRYYVELSTFLDGMFEWANIKPIIVQNTTQTEEDEEN